MRDEFLVDVFPWREEYSVRVPALDEQHRGLVKLLNDLQAAMLSRQGNDVLGRVFDELIAYTQTHFTLEEELMRQVGYPALARHRKEHRRLGKKAEDLRERFRTQRLSLSLETMQFLRKWLDEHIMQYDQAYVSWLAPGK